MASRCLCSRIEALLMGLPMFRTAPAGARWLMFQLAQLLATPAYGGAIPFQDAERVSLLVSMSVSETETYLEKLLETGLLVRTEAGGLACPAMEGLLARTSRAAENGRKGGRPRRGETAQEAWQRRQGHLALPIAGGRPEAGPENPGKPKPESSRASDQILQRESSHLDARELVGLVEELAQIAGMDPARGGYNGAPVRGWLARGATPALLRDVVATVAGRAASPIGSFAYFNRAVEEALAEGVASPAALRAREADCDDDGHTPYTRALERAHRTGQPVPPREEFYRQLRAGQMAGAG